MNQYHVWHLSAGQVASEMQGGEQIECDRVLVGRTAVGVYRAGAGLICTVEQLTSSSCRPGWAVGEQLDS